MKDTEGNSIIVVHRRTIRIALILSLLFSLSCKKEIECTGVPDDQLSWMFYHHGKNYNYKSGSGDSVSLDFKKFYRTGPYTCSEEGFPSKECTCFGEAFQDVGFKGNLISLYMEGFGESNYRCFFKIENASSITSIRTSYKTFPASDSIGLDTAGNYYSKFFEHKYEKSKLIGNRLYLNVYSIAIKDTTVNSGQAIWKFSFNKSDGILELYEKSPFSAWTKQ